MRQPRLRLWMLMTLVAVVAFGMFARRLQNEWVECRRLSAYHAKLELRHQTILRAINTELARESVLSTRRSRVCGLVRREFEALHSLSREYSRTLAEHTRLKRHYESRWW